MIRATTWHEGSVIPAKAGIHPLPPLDAGLHRHDGSKKEAVEGGRAISYSVEESKLMNTLRSWPLCSEVSSNWKSTASSCLLFRQLVTIEQAIIINGILKRHDIAMFLTGDKWHSGCVVK
jgi:hypothetical protein